ncbi:MAG: hypothetical protein SOT71_13695 [Romboutsia timonensis]|uniref:hypothetical protein n=1 Tax=Romboutsia timonensis TaxID=1776391 RepID=UPI002A7518A2|nr:hypothetical protein [Romboutsia timonensis]MDY2883698.1 hypothetical protein [Romboutsia timonensis]
MLNEDKIIQRFSQDDFNSFLKDLIDIGCLEGSALGITKKVINNGFDYLSDKQKYVFLQYVIIPNYIENCKRCNTEIPWCEMLNASYEGNGYCGYCSHMEEKLMEE